MVFEEKGREVAPLKEVPVDGEIHPLLELSLAYTWRPIDERSVSFLCPGSRPRNGS